MTTTAVKERPILFSGPMVRAILEGRKTQTRRMLKELPYPFCEPEFLEGNKISWMDDVRAGEDARDPDALLAPGWFIENGEDCTMVRCPYGQPGDLLWVRETWGVRAIKDQTPGHDDAYPEYWYRATDSGQVEGPWYPSIHMRRDASRITLEVVKVRVERLQDISEEDAKSEGVALDNGHNYCTVGHPTWCHNRAKDCFEEVWRDINGPESWKANPWVWVVEFRRVKP